MHIALRRKSPCGGLESFTPTKRLLPTMGYDQDWGGNVLVWVSDEDTSMALAKRYLKNCGCRVRAERDFSHRYNNSHKLAISKAEFEDITAKVMFLSRVNRTPFASGANLNRKAEMLCQLKELCGADPTILLEAESGWAFDQLDKERFCDSRLDEMFTSAKTVLHKTEGASWQTSS